METTQNHSFLFVLGDILVLLAVTWIGFASHNRLESGSLRFLSTFIPLMVGWGLIGAHVGVFDPDRVADPRQLWRPFWAMVLAGPLVGWMRALFLNSTVVPVFVVILGGVSALALLGWRALYWFLNRKKT